MQFKLDKKRLQQFFLDHTEKIVFGLIVLCFLTLAYKALSRKGYQDQPQNLKGSVETAEKHIQEPVPLPPWLVVAITAGRSRRIASGSAMPRMPFRPPSA